MCEEKCFAFRDDRCNLRKEEGGLCVFQQQRTLLAADF
jgi:hypothetical protein